MKVRKATEDAPKAGLKVKKGIPTRPISGKSQQSPEDRTKAQREASKTIAVMSGAASAGGEQWWWVWELGRPNVYNFGRRPKYFLGCVPGNEEQAIANARARWRMAIGSMMLEEGNANSEMPLPQDAFNCSPEKGRMTQADMLAAAKPKRRTR